MKYWEIGEKNRFGIECYKLHLKLPYGDEKVIAAFVQDENNNNKNDGKLEFAIMFQISK